ncbi:putative RNase H [Trypanosoma cruzi]|uniref:Putative RNase H n=1 Tax=Trypanosoma cruzi TaxID=5693 RepID=A0A2V2X4S5_TRYCR|nr:putative RNase H [Trypanosoma cruzi]
MPFPQHITGTLRFHALQRRSHHTGTEAVPPTTREADAPPVERRPSTQRRKKKCPHCDATLVGHTNHIGHCRCFHPERPPPLPDLHRDCCDTVFPTQKSTAQHRNRCAHNPDATRHRSSSARRQSLLPQDQPASTSATISPQKTLHQLLPECTDALAVRQRLGIKKDLRTESFSQWQLPHSRKLMSLLDHPLVTLVTSCG